MFGKIFKVLFWGSFIVFAAVYIYFLNIHHAEFVKKQTETEKPFQSLIADAVKRLREKAPHKYTDKFSTLPKVSSKTLILKLNRDADGLWFDSLNDLVPKELKVSSPEDVSTMIFLNWTTEKYIKYTNNGYSYMQHCYFIVFDRNKGKILFRGKVSGDKPNPPDSNTGPRPYKEMKNILAAIFKGYSLYVESDNTSSPVEDRNRKILENMSKHVKAE